MKRYQALIQERADLVAEGRALFAAAESEGRDLTEAEKSRDDAIAARLEAIAGELEREERRRERERTVAATPTAAAPLITSVRERAEDDPRRGFANLADFALAVVGACRPGGVVDARLIGAAPTNYHQETGGGSGEGYMVPPAMRDAIYELVFDGTDILGLMSPEPTSSTSVQFIRDETTPWGATGIQAKWRAEATQMTPSKLLTQAEQNRVHELYAFATATIELLRDAPLLSSRLTKSAAQAIRFTASKAVVEGTGVGQPLGYRKSAALVSVAKEIGQAAATIVAANVAKMFSRSLNPGGSVWLANSDIVPQLMLMTLGQQPIWTPPASGFTQAPGGFLFGRPIRFSDHNETLGTKGDLELIDPDGYFSVVHRDGLQFASSMHLYFDYGVDAFRWTFRMGGQPFLSAPVSPNKGAATKSHFITLDTRS